MKPVVDRRSEVTGASHAIPPSYSAQQDTQLKPVSLRVVTLSSHIGVHSLVHSEAWITYTLSHSTIRHTRYHTVPSGLWFVVLAVGLPNSCRGLALLETI